MKTKANFKWIDRKKLYEYRFTYKGERYSTYGRTINECKEKADAKKILLKECMNLDNQKITLEKYYNVVWIEEQKKSVKPSTIYAYSKAWNNLKSLYHLKIVDINKADLINYQKNTQKSIDSINKALRLLKQILNSAVLDRIINFNPCNSVKPLKVEKEKATKTIHRALTESEIKLFLEYSKDSYYYNLFCFLLNSGLRIGEALALQWTDINYEQKEIAINKTVTRISNKAFEVSKTPKTASSNRFIPLTKTLEDILKRQRKQNNLLVKLTMENRIFPNRKSKTANYNTINVVIKNIINNINAEKHKLDYFSVHAFRDTFATHCIKQGMQAQTLKDILGHSTLKLTTDLYVQVMSDTKKAELEKIKIAI